MQVSFWHGSKTKTFHHKRDVDDAKKAFQWVYGYWPTDDQVIKVEDDGSHVEPDDNHKDQMRAMKGLFA